MNAHTVQQAPEDQAHPGATDGARPRRLLHAPQTKRRRAIAAVLVALALLLPLGVTTSLAWSDASDGVTVAERERHGVAYLRPVASLLGALVDAQSAAVRGDQPNPTAITSAVAKVVDADSRHGAELGVSRRWRDLKTRIDQLARSGGTGRTAFEAYGEAVDLTVDLKSRVGDASGLILDPKLDTYYLMDAGMERLPLTMIESGRHADLLRLAADARKPDGTPPDRPPDELFFATTAQTRLDEAAQAVDRDLRIAVEAADAPDFGTPIVEPLDAFRAAVDAFPQSPTSGSAQELASAAGAVTAVASRLREATLRLSAVVFDGLDDLLADRVGSGGGRRVAVGLFVVLGVLAALAAVWLLLPAQAVSDAAPEPEGADDRLSEPIRREPAARRSAEATEALEESKSPARRPRTAAVGRAGEGRPRRAARATGARRWSSIGCSYANGSRSSWPSRCSHSSG